MKELVIRLMQLPNLHEAHSLEWNPQQTQWHNAFSKQQQETFVSSPHAEQNKYLKISPTQHRQFRRSQSPKPEAERPDHLSGPYKNTFACRTQAASCK